MTNPLSVGIQGMTCASCAARVEKVLKQLPGVTEARVNLDAAKATVRYDPTVLQPAHLVGAVREAGYEVAPPGGVVPAKRSCCG